MPKAYVLLRLLVDGVHGVRVKTGVRARRLIQFHIVIRYWCLVPLFHVIICDMIKRNESDFGDVVFEILAKTVFKFLCFILFLALTNSS